MNRQIAEELAFNFRAYGRNGRGDRIQLTPAQARMVARTAARTPEVMVKVLSSGATSAKAVQRHIDYVARKGEVELHTDDGEQLNGNGSASSLTEDWNLDLEEAGATNSLGSQKRKSPPRLAHKLMFSMPPGTRPEKVLSAVQNFCREEFALKHRYVMALHTDEPHPHVHVDREGNWRRRQAAQHQEGAAQGMEVEVCFAPAGARCCSQRDTEAVPGR